VAAIENGGRQHDAGGVRPFATPFTFYSDYFYTDVSVLIRNHWYYVAGN
jgi:hypothetical protein